VLAVVSALVGAASIELTAAGNATVSAEGPALHDTFSRPDNWQIGAAETGQPWELWSGTAVVSGNTAAASVPGYTLAVADARVAGGSVSMAVPTVSSDFWLIFRASNSGNYWRFGRSGGGAYQLDKIAGWALGTATIEQLATIVPAAGDRLECRLTTGITCLVNGTAVLTSPDGFNAGATYAGFAMWDGDVPPATRVDDVSVASSAPAPDVSVSLSAASDPVNAGQPVSWTATVTNVGAATAAGVTLSAPLPAGVGGVSAAPDAGTCSVAATVTCELGSLDAGQSIAVVVAGTAPPQAQTVSLTVTVASTSPDADAMNDRATSSVAVEPPVPPNAVVVDNFTRPDSWSMGTAPTGQTWAVWQGTARVAGGQALASEPGYTMAVLDTGTSTGSVIVSVPTTSSDYWVIARASNAGNYWRFGRAGNGTYELQQVRDWALAAAPIEILGSVAPAAGDELTCRFVAGITCYVNGVAVASSADAFNATATHVGFAAYGAAAAPSVRFDHLRATTPVPAPDLVVDVVSADRWVLAGATMTWTTTVSNTGDQAATGSAISVPLPTGIGSFTVSGPVTSCATAGGVQRCELGTLEPGSSRWLTVSATAPNVIGAVTLRPSVTSVEDDRDPATNRDSFPVSVRVLAAPGEVVSDAFDRVDSPTLGTASGGRPWENVKGTFGVVGGRAAKTDVGPGQSMVVVDPGFTFGTMDVTVASGAAAGFSIIFRARDADNNYRLGPDAAGNYRIEKMINGRITGLQFNAIRANVRATDGDRIRLVVRPDDGWFVSVNGVHVLDGGDLELMHEFGFGLAAASPAVRFDDVSISQRLTTGLVTRERFDHPEESNLELRTPTSGTVYNWLTPEGHWVTRNGAGVLDSAGFGLAYIETSSQLARVQATLRSAVQEEWIVFRHDHDGSYYRFGHLANRRYTIQRVAANGDTLTVPGGVSLSSTTRARAGDVLDLQQSANGTMSGYVNGVLVARATDSSNGVNATSYGLAGSLGATFDDVVITP
jgi:uncharacterized repeat protein (TIGR01451 family)